MIQNEEVDAFLSHFGVKGMHWGFRKEPEHSTTGNSDKKSHKVAIVLGSAAAVTAISVGAIYMKKHFDVKTSTIPKASGAAKKFAEAITQEPVDIIHASRGRNKGFMFLRGGGIKDHLHELEASGLAQAEPGFFKRYGSHSEKVAVSFLDPHGRKDAAGRQIFHQVIFPESMAKHIHTHDDAVKEAWPRIKDIYGALYDSFPGASGPAF